ncbi:hypothetical protein Dsin_027029 [Dipteronia sinensis]|uniref:Uncharacterized protein n=1 Tax=Dipteronia sinensis TaxID=43782 RepID=A0AAD9ZZV2_9ROSI|nr:hypothetical protein Dsin_027029 [Dipteronia sinensis]
MESQPSVSNRTGEGLSALGTALSLGVGAVFGFTFGQEVASHWYQLYRLDTMAAQVKFMECWERKSVGQS